MRTISAKRDNTPLPPVRKCFGGLSTGNCAAIVDPHTEIEAENYARGMAEDRALLVKLLGYDPV